MTRKDYNIIAASIARHVAFAQKTDEPKAIEAIKWLADDLATELKADNSAFDKTRFIRACGL